MKHRAMKFACSMGFLAMADRMVWPPSLSRDWKWPRVTKCTHSRVVGLGLEGNLVIVVTASQTARCFQFQHIPWQYWLHLCPVKNDPITSIIERRHWRYSPAVVFQPTSTALNRYLAHKRLNHCTKYSKSSHKKKLFYLELFLVDVLLIYMLLNAGCTFLSGKMFGWVV